jgi:hypothetical protein
MTTEGVVAFRTLSGPRGKAAQRYPTERTALPKCRFPLLKNLQQDAEQHTSVSFCGLTGAYHIAGNQESEFALAI